MESNNIIPPSKIKVTILALLAGALVIATSDGGIPAIYTFVYTYATVRCIRHYFKICRAVRIAKLHKHRLSRGS